METVIQRTSAATPKSPATPWSPTGYEVIEELNRGGMGVIYKARHRAMGRLVALKVISPETLAHPHARERFEREVWAAAKLNHPNIVTIFDTDLSGPVPFLAMEYVPGIDLLRLVQKHGPLDPAEAVAFTRQAAVGLLHTHEQGLVHRDVKPSNLMVHPYPFEAGTVPRLKILDMGLTRPVFQLTAENAELTPAGVFLGTPDFVAPEQAEDSRRADIRSDVYSLGGTLYFLLTGEAPYPGLSIVEKVRKIHSKPVPAPSSRRANVPSAVDAIVRRMLAPRAADRPQSMNEVIDALDRFSAQSGSNDHAARPIASSNMSLSFFDRETAALSTFQEAVRKRAAAEAELAIAFQTASEKSERD